jgi:hypothetical protein
MQYPVMFGSRTGMFGSMAHLLSFFSENLKTKFNREIQNKCSV